MVIMLIIIGRDFWRIFGYLGFRSPHDEKIHIIGHCPGGHGVGPSTAVTGEWQPPKYRAVAA